MSTVKPSYSGSATAVTVTLASLVNSTTLSTGYRQSTAVDNSTNLYLDALITGKFTTGTGAGASGYISLYLVGWDGTEYSNNATGTDGTFTADATANLIPIYTIAANVASSTFYLPPLLVAQSAGLLWLPQKWAIIVQNVSGSTLSSTGSNHLIEYQGIQVTVA